MSLVKAYTYQMNADDAFNLFYKEAVELIQPNTLEGKLLLAAICAEYDVFDELYSEFVAERKIAYAE